MGFILQLSNFTKEWHFHLPQLMRDMQVGIGILLWIYIALEHRDLCVCEEKMAL